MAKRRFTIVLIKPSHYDDDGYVIQWWRSAIPSNSLASVYGLALRMRAKRHVLGPDVEHRDRDLRREQHAIVRHIPPFAAHRADSGLVALVGVQTNQFPRADRHRRASSARASRSPSADSTSAAACRCCPSCRPTSRGAGARHIALRRRGRGPARMQLLQDASGTSRSRSTTS